MSQRLPRAVLIPLALAAILWSPASALALEAFDGRFQLHGFYEVQLRAMARDYQTSDGFDVTQWYNILNLEMEADIAPDGFGPFDLVSAFGRVEVRYDCVWKRGCGMFRSMDAFGDRAKRSPQRLDDARRAGYRSSGNIFNGDRRRFSDIPREKLPFPNSRTDIFDADSPPARSGSLKPSQFFTIQGIDTLYDNAGVDNIFGNGDDPSPFYFARQERRCTFNYRDRPGSQNGVGNQILPWSPNCPIQPLAALGGKPDPLSSQDFSPILDDPAFLPIKGGFGSGALPFRPQAKNPATYAPGDPEVVSGSVAAGDPRPLVSQSQSQGVYFPNQNAARLVGDFDNIDQNFSEDALAWNHGGSQRDEKELKEAYLDLEMFDSRFWMRVGKQQIVWGKTELFRNQDQWNPQDLALASLPSLEESRIAQWAFRGVWSFYEVGPFEDVRFEVAALFDEFEPTDIGRCGEPYTPNPACNKTLGTFIHGLTGFGVAGEIRPPDPWNSLKGVEVGARIEWRWERFSFALTDYYGHTDLPYQDEVFRYSRNVDPSTGRPRRGMSQGSCTTGTEAACLTAADALEQHYANQQLFRMICATSIGFTALDLTACGQSVFNSQNLAIPSPESPAVSIALSAILSGQPPGTPPAALAGQSLLQTLTEGLAGGAPLNTTAIEMVTFDATGTATPSPLVPLVDDGVSDGDNGGLVFPLPSQQFNGIILLDFGLEPYLTDQQEALLGCGTYYGTRCDVEGVDLMNAEASALFQSMPGFEGTFGVEGALFEKGSWDTTDASVAQPGTIGFSGGTPCTRFEAGTLEILPGCRGPGDPGYDPDIDGSTGGQLHPFTGQAWKSEMSILSWNLLMGLVGFSGAGFAPGGGPETPTLADFDPADPFRTDGCSYATIQYCGTLQAFFQVTGVQRNTIRAGGNGTYGRRDFVWHGGKDVALRYQKRNVLGLSVDFAEDVTKSSWGIEATWQEGLNFADNDELDGIRDNVDTFNVTISVDRPTFINFLNPNRTFFINSQWFIQYVDGYRKGFLTNGPWNFLGVLILETGYFDDRLIPRMTMVYDVGSNSGAFIPQFTYKFSSDFTASFGVAMFTGREEARPMAISPTSLSNRVGRHAYKDFVENGLSAIRDRDEVFLRIRYSF